MLGILGVLCAVLVNGAIGAAPAQAAISASAVWEVRADGTATAGGHWDATVGVPGTDWSQQASPQYTPTGTLTSAGAGAVILYAAASADMVGNGIYIPSGTNFTVGWYTIISAVPGVSITTDRNSTTGVGAAGSGNIGGAMLRLTNVMGTAGVVVAGNTVYVRSGTYSNTTTDTVGSDGTSANLIKVIGYLAGGARTDIDIAEASMPVFTTATNSIAKFTLNGANYLTFRNIKVTDTAATRGRGWTLVTGASAYITWVNCLTDGCLCGFDMTALTSQPMVYIGCTVRNSTSATLGGFHFAINTMGSDLIHCVANDNAGDGFQFHATANTTGCFRMYGCVADTNARDGVRSGQTTGTGTRTAVIQGCTFYANGVDGVHALTTSGSMPMLLINNIFYGNVTTALHCDTASVSSNWQQFGNAFGTNGANRTNIPAGYGDITLTADPFMNGAGRDFRLNFTAGGGLLCRGAGYPAKVGVFDDTTATYLDVGAAQVLTAGWRPGLRQ